MANINVDTVKLRESGNNLMNLANDLGENFEELFNRIVNVPTKTYEWVGESSNNFSKVANFEKAHYINLKNDLYKYGKYLVDSAELLESAINKNKIGN